MAAQLERHKIEENKKSSIDEATLPFYKLLSYADKLDWTMMALGTFGSIIHGLAQPVGYLLMGQALNAYGNNIGNIDGMVHALKKVVPFVWYMAFATFPAGVLEVGCWMYASQRQMSQMRLAFLQAVLRQEIGAFDTDLTNGKVITGMTNHMSIIQDAIGEKVRKRHFVIILTGSTCLVWVKLGHFLSCFAAFFCGVVVAFVCCWEVSLLTLVIVPMILVTGATYTKKIANISATKMSCLLQATALVEQTVSQIKTVYAFVGEMRAIRKFSKCLEKQVKISKGEALIKGIGTGIFQTVTFCSWAIIIYVGAIVVTAKRSSGGDVISAVVSILFGSITLTNAAPDMQIFNQAKVAGKEIFQVINRETKIKGSDSQGKTMLGTINGNIDIQDIYFSYPSRPEKLIMQGFSLSITAGKVVALMGSSGCGKSTIISLVTRFYDPDKGAILIDNHNIRDVDLRFVRQNIGLVSQEPSLFAGTIKENMQIGNNDADDQEIKSASILANAHSFISQLPNQYLTQVGHRGVQLSGGQKQRIAIARAILKNPGILLLDEATSALDSESEKLVQDALETAMKGRTVVLIAHRLSTIVNADTIVAVENGRVADMGTHQYLVDNCQFYNNLISMQNISQGNNASPRCSSDKTTKAATNSTQVTGGAEQKSPQHHKQSQEPTEMTKDYKDPPNEEETENRKNIIFFRIWFGLNKKEYGKILLGFLAAAFAGISRPFFGYFIIAIGVAYYDGDAREKVGRFSVAFSSIGLLSLFGHTVQHYFFGVVGEKAMTNLRQALYSAALQNELAWFEKSENSIELLTTRIIHETTTVKNIISDRMSVIVQCISSILIALVISIKVNWRMALVAWAVMPCHFIGGLIQAKSAKGFSSDSTAKHSEIVSLASESAANIKTVASFCQEENILKKAKLSLEKPMRQSRRESIKYGIIQGVSLCLWNIAHAVALWYTTVLVERQQATFKDGVRSYQIFSLTVPSVTELWTLIPALFSAITILTPVFKTLDRCTKIDPGMPENTLLERIEGEIEFKNVFFNYPTRPQMTILDNFTLKIEAGSRVALVGSSGAGKSSVLALLLRFYDTIEGMVLVDGKNIKGYNLRKLRCQIGLVQQEPLLFSLSIRENICYGNEGASEAEIIDVSRQANIHEFISNLQSGYDTIVGESGCRLSGGQRQRVAIARALLKRPSIMLLDEATSALDAASERAVMSALEKYDGSGTKMTQVIVAHRLSTVISSDTIVVMESGKVKEKGSHTSLIASAEGLYSKLYRLQSK